MICKNCGKDFEGKFCPECGAKAELNAELLTHCPYCGTERIGGSAFCSNCGFSFKTGQAQVTQQPIQYVVQQPSKFMTNFPTMFAKIYRYLGSCLALFMGIFGFICLAMPTLVISFLGMSESIASGYEALAGSIDSSLTATCAILLVLSIGYLIYGAIQLYFAIKRPYKLVKNIASWVISGTMSLIQFILGCVVASFCGGDDFAGAKLGGCFACCIAFGIIALALLGLRIFYEIKFFKIEDAGLNEEKLAKSKEKIDIIATIKKIDKKLLLKISAPIVIVVLIIAIVVPVSMWAVNIFRVGKVDKINIGDTQQQVENVLGQPFVQNDYKWEYYDQKYINLTEKIKKLAGDELGLSVVKSKEENDLEDLFDEAEGQLGQLEKFEKELQNLVYEYIEITFDSNRKVSSVMLDKAKCDKQDYQNIKEVKNCELVENEYLAFIECNIIVCTSYKDGSYFKHSVSTLPADFASNVDGKYKETTENIEFKWTDPWNNKLNATFEIKSKNNENIKQIVAYDDFYFIIDKDNKLTFYDLNIEFKNIEKTNNKQSIIEKLLLDNKNFVTSMSNGGSRKYAVTSNCLVNTETKELIFGCNSSIIPQDILSIGDYAFKGCANITSISIPSYITYIGEYAFDGCEKIETATLPTTAIDKISKTKLQTVVINGGNSIEPEAFKGCANITSISIPSYITYIGEYAFDGCENIETATLPTTAINKISKTKLQTVVINGGNSIEPEAFKNCTSLNSIKIPNSVTSIGDYAFEGCTNLSIYCEFFFQPTSWNKDWNPSNCMVYFGYGIDNPIKATTLFQDYLDYIKSTGNYTLSKKENGKTITYKFNNNILEIKEQDKSESDFYTKEGSSYYKYIFVEDEYLWHRYESDVHNFDSVILNSLKSGVITGFENSDYIIKLGENTFSLTIESDKIQFNNDTSSLKIWNFGNTEAQLPDSRFIVDETVINIK